MRNAFLKKLMEFAGNDKDIILITGDLGFNFLEPYRDAFPGQFINAGICEQSMAGIAAGMALAGKRVFMYSLANFPTLRCLEQLRNDICYHRLPVTIVTNGGGLAYGNLGMSHHATEDLSVMRALPEMTVCVPADPQEVEAVMDYLHENPSPSFLRMSRGGEPPIREAIPVLSHPGLFPLEASGKDVLLIAAGEIGSSLKRIVELLKEQGIFASAYTCPILKPFPVSDLHELSASGFRLMVSIEENNHLGGLGGALAEFLAEKKNHPPLCRIGMENCYSSSVGKQDFLREVYGLSPESVCRKITAVLNGSGK